MLEVHPENDPNRTLDHTPAESLAKDTPLVPETEFSGDTPNPTWDRGTKNPDFDADSVPEFQPVRDNNSTIDYAPAVPTRKQRVVDGYQILGTLGRGGMGIVYKARDLNLNRIVALKMILGGDDANSKLYDRFQLEAEAVAKLQHPNIVQIFAIGQTGGLPYFSLEFIDGQSLAQKIGKEPQTAKFAAETVETLARAIQVAHTAKIIHRDLKPANVLLSRDGILKIADFGLAKQLEGESEQTQSGAIVGTPSYMSPEQAIGASDVGPPADIYALGAILYDLLTGRPPFSGSSIWDTLEMVRKMEPVPPTALTAKVPLDLETICLKCLQKEAAKRYATAVDLAEDLRRYLDGRPILARPVSSIEKVLRWTRRNPVVAGLTTAVVVMSLVFGIAMTIQRNRSEQLRIIADDKTILAVKSEAQAVKSEAQAVKSEAQATERASMSVTFFRSLITKFQDSLKTHPAGRVLRETVTRQAMSDLDELKKLAIQSPVISRTEAGTLVRMGDLYLAQNRPADADALYAKAEVITRTLITNDANDPVFVRNLAAVLNLRGDASVRLGQVVEADKLYRSSLTLREKWSKMASKASADSTPASAPLAIAQSYGILGKNALRLGDPAKAMEYFTTASAGFQAVPNELSSSDFQGKIGEIQELSAVALFKLGKTAQAEASLLKLLKDRLQLVKSNNTSTNRQRVAIAKVYIGDQAIRSGNPSLFAWSNYMSALSIFQEPLKIDPFLFSARQDVAMTHFKLGIAVERLVPLSSIGGCAFTQALAERHFNESLRIMEDLAKDGQRDTQSQFVFSAALARCGRVAEAEKIVDDFLAASPTDPMVRFYSANTLSMAVAGSSGANAERLREKAIGLIEAMQKDGWKDPIGLATEPTLDPIRKHPKFPIR